MKALKGARPLKLCLNASSSNLTIVPRHWTRKQGASETESKTEIEDILTNTSKSPKPPTPTLTNTHPNKAHSACADTCRWPVVLYQLVWYAKAICRGRSGACRLAADTTGDTRTYAQTMKVVPCPKDHKVVGRKWGF
jgi:hypothetical protein